MDPSKQSKLTNLLVWLAPTVVELAVYIFIIFFTMILCSQEIVNHLVYANGDFNPIRSGVASIDALLTHIVGEKVAGSLSLGIFWGTVGLLVNVLWWVGANFSTELNNDLVFSRYVHPKDTDPKSHFREFMERTAIRTAVAVIAIIYTNYVVSQGLPQLTQQYADLFNNWNWTTNWQPLIGTILFELIILHLFVILARVIMLRKKVFDV